MKITDVTVVHEPERQTAIRNWREGLPRRSQWTRPGRIQITAENGQTGQCQVRDAGVAESLVERQLRSELVGQDLFAREFLWERMWEVHRLEYMPTHMLGMVDIALWDLTGRILGLPVYKLAGYYRESIPAYASTATFSSAEEYLEVIDQCLELGYPAVKLHAWGHARRDAKLVERVREHVGDDVPLLFDASGGFDLIDAVYLGRALSAHGFEWYEEPLREHSIAAHRMLSERVDVPLITAEITEGAHLSAADFITSGGAVGVRVSGEMKAGVTGALKIASLADAFRIRAEVHGPGIVNAHLSMAIPNNTYYESLVLTNPVTPDPALVGGVLHAPTAPGIGWEEWS